MADQWLKVSGTNLSYNNKKEIGQGAFSIVFQGLLEGSAQPLAVKRIQRNVIKEDYDDIKSETGHMLKAHDHCNILRYICTESDVHFWYIVFELCHGTLDDYVKKSNYQQGSIKFQSAREVLLQITQGLDHLHRQTIVHRDIKPSNILVFIPECIAGEEVKPLIKLADFGLSRLLKPDKTDFTNSNVNHNGSPSGTICWTAPELYDKSIERYEFEVDIFPLGCIFGYTLSGGKHPFGSEIDDNRHLILARIIKKEPMLLVQADLREPYSNDASAFQLIQTMVHMNPKKRPTVGKILMDEFFKITINERKNELFAWIRTTSEFTNYCNDGSLKNLSENEFTQFVKRMTTEKAINTNATFSMGGRTMTLLHYTCSHCCQNRNFLKLVSLLLDNKGANINALDHYGDTPLYNLCANYEKDNLADIVLFFIRNDADIQLRTPNGWNLVHVLCLYYNNINLIDVISLLVKQGVPVNLRTSFQWTPLHFLLKNYQHQNMIDIVRLLIDNRAAVNAENDGSWTPLHSLTQNYKHSNMIDIVQLFIEKGADVNAKNDRSWTPLHFLLKSYKHSNMIEIVKILIEKGVDVNAKNNESWTPLHTLIYNYVHESLIDIVQLLIDNGADVDARTSRGHLPIDFLKSYPGDNRSEIERLLKRQ